MQVHVSIHDVSPAWEREVDLALELCHAVGAKPALLVVPDFHGRAPLADSPAFCERLRELARDDHEILLHGFFHKARPPATDDAPLHGRPNGLRWKFAQKVVSAGEAEFSDVSREEAAERLDAGARALRDVGLEPTGFVPPAWSMPGWLMPMLGARGFGFTEDHFAVYDPAGGRSRRSVVLNFASRTPGRLFSSALWCRVARPLGHVAPARVAIHPADMRFALLRDEVRSLLAWSRGRLVPRASDLLS
ncbi:MAG: polysaccharide deacetylase family protein [Myxococcales bacterium]|nr:polysaccharide deacetylase family protein [Myxococcales bacterium]